MGDKLIPALLRALGEPLGAVINNLDRAERLGWLVSADEWLNARQLRNQMIHEYVEDPAILASALQAGHERVPMLVTASTALVAEIEKRGWLVDDTSGHPPLARKATGAVRQEAEEPSGTRQLIEVGRNPAGRRDHHRF